MVNFCWDNMVFYSLMVIFGGIVGPSLEFLDGETSSRAKSGLILAFAIGCRITTILAMLSAGLILQHFNRLGNPLRVCDHFFDCFYGTRLSSALLKRQFEPEFLPQKEYLFHDLAVLSQDTPEQFR
jgi:hypothetical protein